MPDEHDYPAAASYLSLLVTGVDLDDLIRRLKAADINYFKAKDMLRASRPALLPVDNPHVASYLRKIKKGQSLSAVLLVPGDLALGQPLQIADGYPRLPGSAGARVGSPAAIAGACNAVINGPSARSYSPGLVEAPPAVGRGLGRTASSSTLTPVTWTDTCPRWVALVEDR